jgi:hypothetical protein
VVSPSDSLLLDALADKVDWLIRRLRVQQVRL